MATNTPGTIRGPGRTLPEFMDPGNRFGELSILLLEGSGGKKLPRNPYLIGKTIINSCGQIEASRSIDQTSKYILYIRNPEQVKKAIAITELIDGTPVKISPHPTLKVVRCVVSCCDLIEMSEDDILAEMQKQKVIRVQRITRKTPEGNSNTPILIFSIQGTVRLEYLSVGLLRVATRPYYPNPMLCYQCYAYGHSRQRCPNPAVCSYCSGCHQIVEGEECSLPQQCRNCSGDHRPGYRKCPVFIREMEIIKVRIDNNISFQEARERIVNGPEVQHMHNQRCRVGSPK